MNMDYSKFFKLLNQDIEKEERNKMAEKAVHDNLYNRGYRDGTAILDKIKAKIEQIADEEQKHDEKWAIGLRYAVKIIDKYRAESEK